jgi:hypothetical protein
MIQLIKGVVQKILVNSQYGLTSFTIKGQDGFYSLGKDKPTFKEGDSIQFETNPVGKYTYAKDIAPWTDGGVASAPSVASVTNTQSNRSFGGKGRSFGGGTAAKDEYWAAKEARDIAKEGDYALTQKRIEIQAARNAAIAAATVIIEKGLVIPPKKQSDQYDHFIGLVDQLTTTFMANTQDRLTIDTVAEAQQSAVHEKTPASMEAPDKASSDSKWE